jgi:uncharacterized protein (TIRG00374 family)
LENGRLSCQDPVVSGRKGAEEADGGLRSRLLRGTAGVGLVLVIAYSAMLVVTGRANLLEAASNLDPRLLALPFIATFFSYLTMSLSYEGIVRAAGATLRSRDMLRITFIANTANYVLPSGGLTGFALRLVFFTRRGITAGRAVAISFTQTMLTNLMLVVFVVYGLLNLLASREIAGFSLVAALVMAGGLIVILILCLAMIYRPSVRAPILEFAARLCDRLLELTRQHERFGSRVRRLFAHVGDGMDLVASSPGAMVVPSLWIFLDWLFMIGTLYLGFYATGYPITFSAVTIAFSVSIILAIVSFVPGGAGVLEGALAATFHGLGVPLQDSLLPIFLYRVSYFGFPAVVSLIVLRGAFRDVTPAEAEMAEEAL